MLEPMLKGSFREKYVLILIDQSEIKKEKSSQSEFLGNFTMQGYKRGVKHVD